MKATRPGKILGYALEAASSDGKVLLFVQPCYYFPPQQLALLNQMVELQTQVSELQDLKAQALERSLEKVHQSEPLVEVME
jgi:hypothetical protein